MCGDRAGGEEIDRTSDVGKSAWFIRRKGPIVPRCWTSYRIFVCQPIAIALDSERQ